MSRPPRALLLDYGGTLVEEVAFDTRAGIDILLAAAENSPSEGVVAGARAAGMHAIHYVDSRTAGADVSSLSCTWPDIVTLVRRAL
ncbi:MAG TPA: hypothetical protein VN706_01515 [Gemmatimonadaceae bacterium]|nr:hypothetical protein [Gemmatimonadaceae bacterium]